MISCTPSNPVAFGLDRGSQSHGLPTAQDDEAASIQERTSGPLEVTTGSERNELNHDSVAIAQFIAQSGKTPRSRGNADVEVGNVSMCPIKETGY